MTETKHITAERTKVTRVEVIDDSGRAFVAVDLADVQLSYQDDGRTLKIFVRKKIEQFVGTDSR